MSDLCVGHILHITRLDERTVDVWARVTSLSTIHGSASVDWLTAPKGYAGAPGYISRNMGDLCSVVDVADLPEDICVLLAKRALLGES
jgi:hypothetical protein